MARRKTARQVAASRQNIKKAQLVSARKRRGKGRSVPTKPGRQNRVVAHIGRNKGKYGTAVGLVAVAGAGYYLSRPITLYHTTTRENAIGIIKNGLQTNNGRAFFSTGKPLLDFGDVSMTTSARRFNILRFSKKDDHHQAVGMRGVRYTTAKGIRPLNLNKLAVTRKGQMANRREYEKIHKAGATARKNLLANKVPRRKVY